jgi:hypothetical protein
MSKERQSERVKMDLLNKKRKRDEKSNYVTAQKVVKDYRERQKSHAVFKRKVATKNRTLNHFDKTKEGSPVIIIRIAGYAIFNPIGLGNDYPMR